jgi:lysophospholipase L1-like esterase
MKTLVCYGDSNTWGFIPFKGKERPEKEVKERYPIDVRWTGRLADLLGDGYRVVEEGLNGRTTAFNDVFGKYRNGARYLGVCLATQKPVDLLILMLGVNDTKRHLLQSSSNIARGIEKLIKIAESGDFGPEGGSPEILLISPVHAREEIMESFVRLEFDQSSIQKSHELAELYFDVARKHDCYYMNAAVYAEASKDDGLHLNEKNHRKVAEAVGVKIKEIFEIVPG